MLILYANIEQKTFSFTQAIPPLLNLTDTLGRRILPSHLRNYHRSMQNFILSSTQPKQKLTQLYKRIRTEKTRIESGANITYVEWKSIELLRYVFYGRVLQTKRTRNIKYR